MSVERTQTARWLRRLLVKGVERRHWSRLTNRCSDPDAIVRHGKHWLCEVGGLAPDVASRLIEGASDDEIQAELELMEGFGARLLTRFDDEFPYLLKQMAIPPVAVSVAGVPRLDDELAVAIVGPRKPSPYGREMARRLAADLARAGLTIVSGFAVGVDATAHRAALECGGRTIGVLGCGLSVKYPSGHDDLRQRILDGRGCLISEYGMTAAPLAANFPPRNQIIAGLSQAVIVVEAAQRSGALVTARAAVEENRHVYAVPADVTRSTSQGSNALLRAGAMPLLRAEDLLEDLGSMLEAIARRLDQDGELRRTLSLNPATPESSVSLFAGLSSGADGESAPLASDASGATGGGPTIGTTDSSGVRTEGGGGGANALDADSRLLVEHIARDPMIDLDSLMAEFIPEPFDMGRLTSVLLRLELAGVIRQLPGRRYVKH